MFTPRSVRSALWVSGAGLALASLVLWAGPGNVTPVSVLILLAWTLAINSALAIQTANVRALMHTGWPFGVLLGVALAGRYALDAAVPAANPQLRSSIMSQAAIVILLAAGMRGGWRSRSARVGALVAMAGAVIGSAISLAVYVPLFLGTVLRNDPDPGEALVVPAIVTAVAAVIGTVGGMFGNGAAGLVAGRTPTVDAGPMSGSEQM